MVLSGIYLEVCVPPTHALMPFIPHIPCPVQSGDIKVVQAHLRVLYSPVRPRYGNDSGFPEVSLESTFAAQTPRPLLKEPVVCG